jgi:hypothetical protein
MAHDGNFDMMHPLLIFAHWPFVASTTVKNWQSLLLLTSLLHSVADPGSGAFLTPGSGIGFFPIPDPKPIYLRA